MFDVCVLGESLIDCVIQKTAHKLDMEGNVGGAPINLAVCIAKYGLKSTVITRVGDDIFGSLIREELEAYKVCTDGLIVSKEDNTTLALVSLDENGDRSFSFYRKHGADVEMKCTDVDLDILKNSRAFHFGTVSMTRDPARTSTLYAAERAKEMGLLVSFDPNLRSSLWDNLDEAKESMRKGLAYTDVLKIAEEELSFVSDTQTIDEGLAWLKAHYPSLRLISVTCGSAGCVCVCNGIRCDAPGFAVDTIDTTGAGDTFGGTMLYQLLMDDCDFAKVDRERLYRYARFANAAGAISTTKMGAAPAIPTVEEVNAFLREHA